jgi:hypothetical protein
MHLHAPLCVQELVEKDARGETCNTTICNTDPR